MFDIWYPCAWMDGHIVSELLSRPQKSRSERLFSVFNLVKFFILISSFWHLIFEKQKGLRTQILSCFFERCLLTFHIEPFLSAASSPSTSNHQSPCQIRFIHIVDHLSITWIPTWMPTTIPTTTVKSFSLCRVLPSWPIISIYRCSPRSPLHSHGLKSQPHSIKSKLFDVWARRVQSIWAKISNLSSNRR